MKRSSHIIVAAVLVSSCFIASAVSDSAFLWTASDEKHPGNALSKVTVMLERLKYKVQNETERAIAYHQEYMIWYDDTKDTTERELRYHAALAEKSNAKLVETTAVIKEAQAEIDELSKDITMDETQLRRAALMRDREREDHEEELAELKGSLKALNAAIGIIGAEMKKNYSMALIDMKSLKNVVQTLGTMIDAAAFSAASQEKLMSLIQSVEKSHHKNKQEDELANKFTTEIDQIQEPEKKYKTLDDAGYESRSGEIFNLLEDMKEKAEKQYADMLDDEIHAREQFAILSLQLKMSIKEATESLEKQKEKKGAALKEHMEEEKDYNRAMSDVNHMLESQAKNKKDYEQTQLEHEMFLNESRDELEAINIAKTKCEEAIGAVDGDGNFTQIDEFNTTGTFAPVAASFVELESSSESSSSARTNAAKAKALDIVRTLAHDFHNPLLMQLAAKMKTMFKYNLGGSDPFAKVKNLIRDMIQKLSDSLAKHQEEKAFCDKEMPEVVKKLEEYGVDITRLDRLYEMSYAKEFEMEDILRVTEEQLRKYQEEQAKLDAIYHNATRNYAFSKEQLTEALAAVTQAVEVLTKFYGAPTVEDEEEAATLLQVKLPAALLQSSAHAHASADASSDASASASSNQTKQTTHGHGIIAILEIIREDIAKSLEMAIAEWEGLRAEYDDIMAEYLANRQKGLSDLDYYNSEYIYAKRDAGMYRTDEDSVLKQKEQLSVIYLHLKDRCETRPITHAEIKAKRDKEIEGLKEALRILEDETAFLQRDEERRLRHSHRGLHLRGLSHHHHRRLTPLMG